MKTLIYTAIIGPRDNLKDPAISFPPDVDMVCITDQPVISVAWDILPLHECRLSDDCPGDQISLTRYFKLMPHRTFPDYDYWVWLDASYHIRDDVRRLTQSDFAVYKHPSHGVIYREIDGIIRQRRADSRKMRALEKRYRAEGIPPSAPVAACGAIWRRNCDRVNRFDELWWDEFIASDCGRDMPPFAAVTWRTGFQYTVLPQDHTRNRFLYLGSHTGKIFSFT